MTLVWRNVGRVVFLSQIRNINTIPSCLASIHNVSMFARSLQVTPREKDTPTKSTATPQQCTEG
jgi:hypothetical protein